VMWFALGVAAYYVVGVFSLIYKFLADQGMLTVTELAMTLTIGWAMWPAIWMLEVFSWMEHKTWGNKVLIMRKRQ